MIITIDGPAGAGKSNAARGLAQRLGFDFLDTGAMYRAVTLAALRARIDLRDQDALARLLTDLRLELPPGRVLLNGEDVTRAIRTKVVTDASGAVADSPVVRRQLTVWQRQITEGRDTVTEGRDQGTLVFPDAACKFFLVADPAERARRRQLEMEARGEVVALVEVLRAQEVRDRRDAARDLAPMVPAAGAIEIDTTHLTLDEVIDRMEQEVRRCPGWLSYLFYETMFFLSFTSFSLGWSLRVRGRRNIPRTGPVLLIANHQSYLDPLLVGLASPRHLGFLAKKTLFDHALFGFLIRSLQAVPIDQEGIGIDGLKTILQQLHAGRAVLVFPEGSRTDDGQLVELRPGIQLLLKRVQVPIVPVGLAGAWDAWPRHQPVPLPAPLFLPANRRTLAVSVGKPVDGQRYAKLPREQAMRELFDVLRTEHENAERLRRK